MRFRYIIVLFTLMCTIACVDDKIEDPVVDQGIQYFPLSVGRYIEYEVDSIVFDDAPGGNKKDTIRFQLREEITSYQLSTQQDTVFYLHRSRRDHEADAWKLKDVWTAVRSESVAYRTEENLKFIKMIFPLKDGRKWIPTSYIYPKTKVLIGTENLEPYAEWEATVNEIDINDQVGDFIFTTNQIMHITQTDTDDGSMKRFVFEKYARNIGLVEKTDTILDSRCIDIGDFTTCIGKSWLEHASKGYILSQVMIGHN